MSNLLVLDRLDDARLLARVSNDGHSALIVGVVEMRSELLLLAEDVMDLCAELAAPNAETGDLIAELAETADEWAIALSVDGEMLGKLAFDDVRAAFDARPVFEPDEGSSCAACPMIVADTQLDAGMTDRPFAIEPGLLPLAELGLRSLEKEWLQIINNRPNLTDEAFKRLKQEPVVAKLLSDIAAASAVVTAAKAVRYV
ncbi:hypothetical protein KL86APRO_40082 [uncultured Alphaproteobacteria bacterium]|uniref:Uncharacterized protein n=1 Tax=uncultured Alphaproteobacteria bacterium TaxID=91750 RepID=A0A212KN30_9PROT|nr:hypothetical protein KL86APRO_40082 [uncultured Alphaproteobacteria bacterium]